MSDLAKCLVYVCSPGHVLLKVSFFVLFHIIYVPVACFLYGSLNRRTAQLFTLWT